MLREMSQVHPDDKAAAQDIKKHPYFNTNSIWIRIDALKAKLAEYNGVLPLPVIRNKKTVNPTNDTEQVIQLETAMGAAIALFNRCHLRAGGSYALSSGEDHQRICSSCVPIASI